MSLADPGNAWPGQYILLNGHFCNQKNRRRKKKEIFITKLNTLKIRVVVSLSFSEKSTIPVTVINNKTYSYIMRGITTNLNKLV